MPTNPPLTTPGAILRAALEKERQAHDFYDEASQHTHIEMVRDLLDTLKNEETRHIKLIQAMLARLELG